MTARGGIVAQLVTRSGHIHDGAWHRLEETDVLVRLAQRLSIRRHVASTVVSSFRVRHACRISLHDGRATECFIEVAVVVRRACFAAHDSIHFLVATNLDQSHWFIAVEHDDVVHEMRAIHVTWFRAEDFVRDVSVPGGTAVAFTERVPGNGLGRCHRLLSSDVALGLAFRFLDFPGARFRLGRVLR